MRASRYPLHLTALYQPVGDSDWREGKTVDISSSGVLIEVDDPLPLGTSVEFRLVLPPVEPGTPQGEIHGRGRVARLAGPPASSHWRCAVAIEQYEFNPGDRA
jgi:PilZ domain